MAIGRCLVYAHCAIVVALTGFALWGVKHYGPQEMWRFERFVELLLSNPIWRWIHVLLHVSLFVFPAAVLFAVMGVNRANKATWRSKLIILLDFVLSLIQGVALMMVSPVRD